MIKEADIKAGVALNPATPIDSVDWILEYLDFVLIMSVNPRFGGQSFISNSLEKIRTLKNMISDKNLSTLIQIDGGVSQNTIKEISMAGTDSVVAGSAIFGSNDYKKTIDIFREKIS